MPLFNKQQTNSKLKKEQTGDGRTSNINRTGKLQKFAFKYNYLVNVTSNNQALRGSNLLTTYTRQTGSTRF